MNGRKADVLHHAEDPVQHALRDHAAALGEYEAKEPVYVDGLPVHDVGTGNHLDDLAEGVPIVNASVQINKNSRDSHYTALLE